jgi:uncharacterized protein YacL
MKSRIVQRILRGLVTLLGAGVGIGLAMLGLRISALNNPNQTAPLETLMLLYGACALVGGLIFFILSPLIIRKFSELGNAMEKQMDNMPMHQVLTSTVGLITGLVIAVLVTQILQFVGASIVTTAFSGIVYVVLGYTGLNIGRKRGKEMQLPLMEAPAQGKERRFGFMRSVVPVSTAKILDTSVIIDGRVFDICKTGFLEGELVIPQFVLAELRHIADSSDALRRNRGRRGLDVLGRIQSELKIPVRIEDTDYDDVAEVDVKLLRLARQLGGIVVTNDYNLNKVAGVTGVKVLNINELANAVKPVVLPGEEMTIQIVREGKEPGQGVGYLDDGTMIVVDNARRHVGETIDVVVTTVLQTSAGRMIFTRIKAYDASKAG